ncbi:MAG: ABC transporter ATP-binding protein [Deltaproteobacteria bacterium]|nr:ABC transporter ATP-binding protein [Deltaproteobacteria bacterium]
MKKTQNHVTRDTVTKHETRVMEAMDLAVGYGRKTVVAGINQEMLKGQFICLLGPNGSGKTTILRTLSRLLSPLKGAVYLNGRMLNDLNSVELAKALAVVLTERLSPGLITAFEFSAMGRHPYTGFLGRLSEEDIRKTEEALLLVNAGDISDRYFNELSDGERQKVILARALAQEPEVIVLDEPTLHLDLKHRIELIAILRRFSREKGITVIVSLHDVDIALKIAETVILVKDGTITECGPPEEVVKEETIARLYDLNYAHYSNCLGAMELKANGDGAAVYVVAGGGTGTAVYRLLSKHGFNIITGVIHENDIDCHVARSIGAKVISEKPFGNIRKGKLHRSFAFLEKAECLIDSGFPIGPSNRRNLKLVLKAIERKKRVYTLRHRKPAGDLFGECAQELFYCQGVTSVLKELAKRDP